MTTTPDNRIDELQAEIDRLTRQQAAEQARQNRADREQQEYVIARAGLTVERRDGTRFWNLLDEGGELLAVIVYRKGAMTVGSAIAAARLQAEGAKVAA